MAIESFFRRLNTVFQIIVAPILFVVIWTLFVVPIFKLPSILQILQAFQEMLENKTYFHDILVSSIRGLTGFVIGFTLGVLTGILTGRSPKIYLILGGLLLFLRWTPVLALLPLTIRVGGLGEEPKIFLIAWACYFVSWAYTHTAITKLNPAYVLWSNSLGLGLFDRLFKVYLPAISPALIGAARVALAIAIIVVVAAELGGTLQDGFFRDGLGYRISRAIDTNRNDINIACILTFGMIGVLYDFLLIQFVDQGLRKLTGINFYRKDG
jgi:ABC-type nitrate/sulfonate/bicarbonate transport system permease component